MKKDITIDTTKPFTPEEEEVMALLVEAHGKFIRLPNQNEAALKDWDSNMRDFRRILSMRVMRRLYPDYSVKIV